MQPENNPNWKLTNRVNYFGEGLFKLKAIDQDKFITHLPKKKIIETYDNRLRIQNQTYTFSQDIQAIEYFQLNGSTFVVAGTQQGVLQLKDVQQNETYKLVLPQPISSPHKYINDMLYLGNGRLINCYNNGILATWNLNGVLSNDLAPLSYQQIHSSFTYKIRQMDPETVLTCSNDKFAKLIDLEKSQIVGAFLHDDSVWCSYPINENVFCSAGLMNMLVFWDARLGRIISKCELQSSETSFVTKFEQDCIIFGDGRMLSTCDLRKPIKRQFGNTRMRVSAESILVTGDGVIATGRGGDLCRFIYSQGEVPLEQTSHGHPMLQLPMNRAINFLDFLINRHLGDAEEEQDLEFEEADEQDLPWHLDEQNEDQELAQEADPGLNQHENQYFHMMDEEEDDSPEEQQLQQPQIIQQRPLARPRYSLQFEMPLGIQPGHPVGVEHERAVQIEQEAPNNLDYENPINTELRQDRNREQEAPVKQQKFVPEGQDESFEQEQAQKQQENKRGPSQKSEQ